jgi:tight adherence protein B
MQIQKLPELTSLTLKLRGSIPKRKTATLFFMLTIVALFTLCAVIKNLFPLITTLVFSYVAYFIFNFIKQRNDLLLYKELERFMDIFMSGLSAGLSVNKAMEFALDGLGGSRFKKIFDLVSEQLVLNIRPHIAIRKAGEEFKIKELELLAVILESQLRAGFPPNKLLLQVRSVIVDRMRFSRKIKLFNSQNELSANILSSVPVLLLGSVMFFKSEYLHQLNQNFSAQLFLLLAVLMDIAGLWMMRRLTRYGG